MSEVETAKQYSPKVTEILDKVGEFTLIELSELVEAFEERFGSLRCAVLRPEGFKEANPPHLCEGLTRDALDLSIRYVSRLAGRAETSAGGI